MSVAAGYEDEALFLGRDGQEMQSTFDQSAMVSKMVKRPPSITSSSVAELTTRECVKVYRNVPNLPPNHAIIQSSTETVLDSDFATAESERGFSICRGFLLVK